METWTVSILALVPSDSVIDTLACAAKGIKLPATRSPLNISVTIITEMIRTERGSRAQHEDRTLTHGYEPTRECAMAAFAKS
jgi:hypothetical protein